MMYEEPVDLSKIGQAVEKSRKHSVRVSIPVYVEPNGNWWVSATCTDGEVSNHVADIATKTSQVFYVDVWVPLPSPVADKDNIDEG